MSKKRAEEGGVPRNEQTAEIEECSIDLLNKYLVSVITRVSVFYHRKTFQVIRPPFQSPFPLFNYIGLGGFMAVKSKVWTYCNFQLRLDPNRCIGIQSIQRDQEIMSCLLGKISIDKQQQGGNNFARENV